MRITSSWSAMGCAKRSRGRRRKRLHPLLHKRRPPLLHELQNPLLSHKPRNLLLHEPEDPWRDELTATNDIQLMPPSLAHGASKDRSMKHYWLRTAFLWMAMAACSGQAWPADMAPPPSSGAAPAARPTGPDMVTLNFVNADIEGVVKAVSEIAGKNFVLDPRVKGTVNIVSARPMSRALVYEVFLSAMRLQGFTAVEERGRVMIVPEIDAKLHQSLATGAQEKPRAAGDTVQTQVFKLQYESATQMVPVLRPLITS